MGKERMKRFRSYIILFILLLLLLSSCKLPVEEVDDKETQGPEMVLIEEEATPTKKAVVEPTPTLDISEWFVKIGEMECKLEQLDDVYPERFVAMCPKEVWLPIGQITQVDVIVGESCLDDLKSAEGFREVMQKHFPGARQVEFVQMEDRRWGCQVPFSDTAGLEVVCGIGCEEIRIILKGKTIRNYSENSSGGDGNS